MSQVSVFAFSISLDGFGTGEGQSAEAPFGHAGERLHEWMFATAFGRAMLGQEGGGAGVDDAWLRRDRERAGVEIMGAGKFGPPGWQDDPDWKGWWGSNPTFHTPVYVLTHRPRPSIEMEGGTTYHFLDASPQEAVAVAAEAAGDRDVNIGGGVATVREFVSAGLVDHLHLVVVPILLGRGERVWDGLEGLESSYDLESVSSPSGVTHLMFTKRP